MSAMLEAIALSVTSSSVFDPCDLLVIYFLVLPHWLSASLMGMTLTPLMTRAHSLFTVATKLLLCCASEGLTEINLCGIITVRINIREQSGFDWTHVERNCVLCLTIY